MNPRWHISASGGCFFLEEAMFIPSFLISFMKNVFTAPHTSIINKLSLYFVVSSSWQIRYLYLLFLSYSFSCTLRSATSFLLYQNYHRFVGGYFGSSWKLDIPKKNYFVVRNYLWNIFFFICTLSIHETDLDTMQSAISCVVIFKVSPYPKHAASRSMVASGFFLQRLALAASLSFGNYTHHPGKQ